MEMVSFRPCSVPHCAGTALTGLSVCSVHCDDVVSYARRIAEILHGEKRLVDYDISGITLADLDASGVQVSGCNLAGLRLRSVLLRKSSFQLVFCDSAEILACDFSGSTLLNSVFAGSLIEECLFAESDLLQCNFMGIRCRATTFNHSNLYASRFLGGSFEGVGMKDCNLTRVRFDGTVRGVDFRSSNTNEATFVEVGR